MEIDNQIVVAEADSYTEAESRTKLDSYCSEETGSLNGHISPAGGYDDEENDSRASRDQQIIRDIEAEIDEKLESLSRQSNDVGQVDRSSTNPSDIFNQQELDLSDHDGQIDDQVADYSPPQMCPDEEIRFRIEHDLVHKLEMTGGVPDPDIMVKEFRRSSADNNDLSQPDTMRTKRGLYKTVAYLLGEVMTISSVSFCDKYDFISDRLRSVRQELTIQRLSETWSGCKLLLGCCNFYLVSRRLFYDLRLTERFMDRTHFNEAHLRECISSITVFLKSLSRDEMFGGEVQTTREALSVLLLSSFDALHASGPIYNLVFDQLADLQDHGILLQPLSLCKAFISRDWCRFSRVFHRLSRIQQLSVEPFVPLIRKECFSACAVAYHNQKFPSKIFASWMLMSPDDLTVLLNETPGILLEESPSVIIFNKKDFTLPPNDLFETRAAGELSFQVLADMCQVAEVCQPQELMPLISELGKLDLDTRNPTKDVISTNPLDNANDSDDDEDAVPIWMRQKSNHDKDRPHRNNRHKNRRDSDRKERRDSDRKDRRHSDRSDRDQPAARPSESRNEPGPFWNDGGDKRNKNNRNNKPRNRRRDNRGDNRGGGGGSGGGNRPKVDSTASRSWQHDDRTRTSY